MKFLKLFIFATLFPLQPVLYAEQGTLSSLEKEITNLVDKIKPSVVTIEASSSESKNRFSLKKWVGTGVVWSKDGEIVTTASVIDEDDRITVTLSDGKKFSAKILGIDDETNIALLKIEADRLLPIKRGNSDKVSLGSWTVIIGNSFGLTPSVSLGLVNGIRPEDSLLQLSANVSPGNSGGPVLNTSGEVIGLVSGKISEPLSFSPLHFSGDIIVQSRQIEIPSSSTSLAITINRVKNVCEHLQKHGTRKRGFLGVRIQSLTPELSEHFKSKEGVLISDVIENSSAAKAGIKTGDIITEFDGEKVKGTEEFRKKVAETKIGKKVKIKILREGKEKTLYAELGSAPSRSQTLRSFQFPQINLPPITIPNIEPPAFDRQKLERELKDLKGEIKDLKKELEKLQRELKEKASEKKI